MLAFLVAGCTRPDPQPPLSHPLPPTGGTPVTVPGTPPADVVDARCAVDPLNPLVASCRLSLSWPAPAEIEVTDGEEVAVFSTSEVALQPELPIWGLHAESAWTFVARAGGAEWTGEIVPGPPPEAVRLDLTSSGLGPSELVQVLGPIDCAGGGWLTVVDRRGRVRWTADTRGVDVDLVQLTEADTVLAIADGTVLVELDLAGRERLRKDDLGLPVHHDVFRRDDRIYTLLADARPAPDGVTYVEDLVVALDLDGDEVWRWDERDHLDPTLANGSRGTFWSRIFPGAIDAWHTNGLYVTEEHDVVLSLNREDTVFRVSGADGTIQWVLAGDGVGNVLSPTLAVVGDVGFADQHHPALLPDGHLTVFDNRRDRAVEYALDEDAGTATFVADWDLGLSCPIQSSIFSLPGGGRVVTCADEHVFEEFGSGGQSLGRYTLSCPNGAALPRTTRGQPVDLWDGTTVGEVTATRIQ